MKNADDRKLTQGELKIRNEFFHSSKNPSNVKSSETKANKVSNHPGRKAMQRA